MSLTQRTKTDRTNNPPEVAALTDDLVAQVWQSVRSNGGVAIHWNMARKNPRDETRPYRTMTVESLFQAPAFLAELALALSKVESLRDLRPELEGLARQLDAVDALRFNGGAHESGPTTTAKILAV